MSEQPRILPLGDSAFVVGFEDRIDPKVNARCIAVAAALGRRSLAGVRDVVPTYRSVAVYFDPLRTDHAALRAALADAIDEARAARPDARAAIRIPVCYGGDRGPDLDRVARDSGVAPATIVAWHSETTYRVFMLGFQPGFAYMGAVDSRIVAPRHEVPRTAVPRGSVGIAGRQTGVYPMESPGGWKLIGRTPVTMFDAGRARPSMLAAGDTVRFFPIAASEWDRYA
jgi:KipI family sensor histidine kinase inhibitor